MTEREFEDQYIDQDFDDYADEMPYYDDDYIVDDGWWEDDYTHLDDLDDYSYDAEY